MKLNKIFSKRTAYIMLFGILYLAVAFTSTLHAIQFFGLTNENYLSVVLAIAFEIGQAAVLLSLLTTKGERGKITPWVLMCIFTLVQIIGNVFSSYKYAVLHSLGNLRFFKEPIFVWTSNISDNVANVIVTYISSSILPIAALLLTSMIANYITDSDETLDTPVNEIEAAKHKRNIEDKSSNDETIEDEPSNNIEDEPSNNIEDEPSEKAQTAGVLDNTLIEEQKPAEGEETVSNDVKEPVEEEPSNDEIVEDDKPSEKAQKVDVLDNTLIEEQKPAEGEETVSNDVDETIEDEPSNNIEDEPSNNIEDEPSNYIGEDENNKSVINEPIKVIDDGTNNSIAYTPHESNITSAIVPVNEQIICNKPENIPYNPTENPIDFETARQKEQIKKSGFINL